MTDRELELDIDTELERVELLVDTLPDYFPKADTTNNFKLYGPIGAELKRLATDIEKAHHEVRPSKTTSMELLVEQGKLVGVSPKNNEPKEKFRMRVIARYNNITSEGTIKDIIQTASYILSVSADQIGYEETTTPGLVKVGLPYKALNDISLTSENIVSVLEQNIAVDYEIGGYLTGTFTFISVTDYNNSNHDSTLGYDGLDANGDPKGNGGTYSTLLT